MKLYKWIFFVLIICLIGCGQSSQKKLEYGRGAAYVQAQYGGLAIPLSSGSNEPDLFHLNKHDLRDASRNDVQIYPGTISSV